MYILIYYHRGGHTGSHHVCRRNARVYGGIRSRGFAEKSFGNSSSCTWLAKTSCGKEFKGTTSWL